MALVEIRPAELHESQGRPSGRSFFEYSQFFSVSVAELMPEGYGVAAQVADGDVMHTATFDARNQENGFTWQFTQARGPNGSRGRVITGLTVAHDGEVQGWHAVYDGTGRLETTASMTKPEANIKHLKSIVEHSEAKEYRRKLFATQASQERALGAFSLRPELEVIHRVPPAHFHGDLSKATIDETGDVVVIHKKKLTVPEIEAEITRRESLIRKTGFVALAPSPPPTNIIAPRLF